MNRQVVISRTKDLIEALMRGYVLKTTHGFLLKLDEYGEAYIKGKVKETDPQVPDDFYPAGFNVDMRFYQKEAASLSQIVWDEIRSFIVEDTFIKE